MSTTGFELHAKPMVTGSRVLLDGKELDGVTRVLVDCDVDKGATEVTVFYAGQPMQVSGNGLNVVHVKPQQPWPVWIGHGLAAWLDHNRAAVR